MKQTKNLWGGEYTAPTLEVLDIAVEQGFATSPIGDLEGGDIIYPEWDSEI